MTSLLLACLSNIFEWRTKLDASHVSECVLLNEPKMRSSAKKKTRVKFTCEWRECKREMRTEPTVDPELSKVKRRVQIALRL